MPSRFDSAPLKADRERFFGLSQDVLCVLGFDGYFKDVNPAWERTLGHSRATLLATPFIEFVHPDDRAATLAKTQEVAEGKVTLPEGTKLTLRTVRVGDQAYLPFFTTASRARASR